MRDLKKRNQNNNNSGFQGLKKVTSFGFPNSIKKQVTDFEKKQRPYWSTPKLDLFG